MVGAMAKPPSDRTRVRRLPGRGAWDRATIDVILDEALVCHLGFVDEGQPFVIPTIHARSGDVVWLHGSSASRAMRCAGDGRPICVTVTLQDGLVLARSAFHHSMNYRSVVLLGSARAVTDPDEKTRALRDLSEHVMPGRWAEVREPNPIELRATTVVALPIDEASAKIRSGGPIDDEADLALECWAGVVPIGLVSGPPVPSPDLAPGTSFSKAAAADRRFASPAGRIGGRRESLPPGGGAGAGPGRSDA